MASIKAIRLLFSWQELSYIRSVISPQNYPCGIRMRFPLRATWFCLRLICHLVSQSSRRMRKSDGHTIRTTSAQQRPSRSSAITDSAVRSALSQQQLGYLSHLKPVVSVELILHLPQHSFSSGHVGKFSKDATELRCCQPDPLSRCRRRLQTQGKQLNKRAWQTPTYLSVITVSFLVMKTSNACSR